MNKKTRNIKSLMFGIMVMAWSLFVLSSLQYQTVWWFEWLFLSRVTMVLWGIGAIAFCTFTSKKIPKNFLFWYLVAGTWVQASHGVLEGQSVVDFWQYTGILFISSSLAFEGTIRSWIKVSALAIGPVLIPAFFKSSEMLWPLGKFIDNNSLIVSGIMIGLLVVYLATSKFEMFENNKKLNAQIVSLLNEKLVNEKKAKLELSLELDKIKESLRIEIERSEKAHLAERLAHDIRSPLSALKTAMASLPDSTEKSLIELVAARIRSISEDLLSASRVNSGPVALSTDKIVSLVDQVIGEKKAVTDGIQWEVAGFSSNEEFRINAQEKELMRIVSNLIDNSVYAVRGKSNAKIAVEFLGKDSQLSIRVSDNGTGIPEEVLRKLGAKGVTFGKADGNGLGIFYAKKILSQWKGSLELSSTEGFGTNVLINLPRA